MYKDKALQKETTKDRVRRYRDKQKGVTEQGVTLETVPASYVYGTNGRMYQTLPVRPRYLKLSDGQVLDRANQPIPRQLSPQDNIAMLHANAASYNYTPLHGSLASVKVMIKKYVDNYQLAV